MTPVQVVTSAPFLALAAPFLLAALAALPRAGRLVLALVPLAAVPALVLASAPGAFAPVHLGRVLFGVALHDPAAATNPLLLPIAALWLLAGWSVRGEVAGRPGCRTFTACFLASMAGNFGVLIADDVATFYTCFAVMTYAGYGLVVHHRTAEARRAGRVYLALSLVGEMLLLAGLLLALGGVETVSMRGVGERLAASPHADVAAALLIAGFGVKAGALPVHVWLPLAHPVAPTAASAVLSGAMIKAGLVGWLRLLPVGVVQLEVHGLACMALGIAAALLAAVVGVLQDEPKTVLAYSSISQMGLMTFGVGVALASPGVAPAATAAVVFLAAVHAVAKGALFLGTRVAKHAPAGRARRAVVVGLAWSAANVVGAPLTAGSAAKIGLKAAAEEAPAAAGAFMVLLTAAPVGTALLMARWMAAALRPRDEAGASWTIDLWGPWAALSILGAVALAFPPAVEGVVAVLTSWPDFAGAVAPIVVAAVLVGAALAWSKGGRRVPTVPPGDLLVGVEAAAAALRGAVSRARARRVPRASRAASRAVAAWQLALRAIGRGERSLERFPVIGATLVLVSAALVFALGR